MVDSSPFSNQGHLNEILLPFLYGHISSPFFKSGAGSWCLSILFLLRSFMPPPTPVAIL